MIYPPPEKNGFPPLCPNRKGDYQERNSRAYVRAAGADRQTWCPDWTQNEVIFLAKPKKYEQTKAYAALKTALLDNLATRGLTEKVYTDQVDAYMALWVQKQQLSADVRARGVTVLDQKRGMYVENRSVSLGVQVNKELLNIYTALGFKDLSTGKGAAMDFDDEL